MNQPIQPPQFDPDLISRYDTAGPRYTSYPTAPQFHAGFGEPQLREVIAASNTGPGARPLSLYVHIPFCTSPCFYCGCNRVITRDPRKADEYLKRLFREIELEGPLFDPARQVTQLHFGGGTPSFLSLDGMGALMAKLAQHFSFSPDPAREFGIEIDPRFVDAAYIRGLGELGFNRISVGIQDFDHDVQVAVNRIQSVEQTREVLDAARASGFRSASVDLIYGLPRQTLAGFERTLDEVIKLGSDRVAVYAYAHLPQMFKAQGRIKAEELPDPATRLALFGLALAKLGQAGYVYVGMDHFARADDELVKAQRAGTLQRNFQGYSTHGECDIVGLGVSAIGRIGNSYHQSARDLIGYYAALDAGRLPVVRGLELTRDDLVRREVIGQLMCHGELDMPAFGASRELDFADYFGDELAALAPLAQDGLIELDERTIRVTPRGRLLLRVVAMPFDAYLRQPEQKPRYSRTI